MFYEIRRYQTQSGRRDEWVRYMEDVVIPYQRSKGMTIVGSFLDEQDADGYVWIRRFEDEQDRVTRYTDTYERGPAVDRRDPPRRRPVAPPRPHRRHPRAPDKRITHAMTLVCG